MAADKLFVPQYLYPGLHGYTTQLLSLLACVVLMVFHASAFAADQLEKQDAETIELTPLQAQKLIKQRPELVVVDVRTARERKSRHIDNSLHIPLTDVFLGKVDLSPEQPVLLYCAVGGRSVVAAKLLQKKGFTKIYNLTGGIVEWHRQNLPTVGED